MSTKEHSSVADNYLLTAEISVDGDGINCLHVNLYRKTDNVDPGMNYWKYMFGGERPILVFSIDVEYQTLGHITTALNGLIKWLKQHNTNLMESVLEDAAWLGGSLGSRSKALDAICRLQKALSVTGNVVYQTLEGTLCVPENGLEEMLKTSSETSGN